MPNAVKTGDSLTWHRTKAEIEAREAAEADVLPTRQAKLTMPKTLKGDKAAQGYWRSIVKRMEGLAILDDLDTEMLTIYVAGLSRRDQLRQVYAEVMEIAMDPETDPDTKAVLLGKLNDTNNRLQGQEKLLLSYANALGMTPEARVRLARKKAAKAMEPEPDADLFGD